MLVVAADTNQIRLLINDQEVASLPRVAREAEGVVGLRINHALNLHVSDFKVD